MKQLDKDKITNGYTCMKEEAEKPECLPKFQILGTVVESIPDPAIYDTIVEGICTKGELGH